MTGWRTRLACGSKRKPRSEVPRCCRTPLFCHLRAGILALPMAVVAFDVRSQAHNESMGLNPTLGGAPQQFRLNGPKESAGTSFGQLQGLTSPPGFGAGNTGFDSTNAAKKRKAKTVNKTGNKAGNKAGKPASPPGSPAPGAAATGTPAAPSDPS